MSKQLRVLVVEDSEDDYILLKRQLHKGGYEVEAIRAETVTDIERELAAQSWDIIISDYNLPEISGLEVLELTQDMGSKIPFIIVSGDIDEEAAVAALRAGAQDFIVKGRWARLIPAIERELADNEERKSLEEAKASLDQLRFFETLTGLPNRHSFIETVNKAVDVCAQSQELLSVMMVNLDRFSAVNSSLGRSMGDQLVCALSRRVIEILGENEVVAHLGGDEFAVLAVEKESAEIDAMAKRLLAGISAKPFVLGGVEVFVTASLGVCFYPLDGSEPELLLTYADAAMHYAKKEGNSYRRYDVEMKSWGSGSILMESALHHAVENDQLFMCYQPQFDAQTNAVIGLEALIRWRHPEWGLISPFQFIPLAEQSGMIIPISEWVIKTVCEQFQLWAEGGCAPERVAVNLSPSQFHSTGLVSYLKETLVITGMDPKALELEITENIAMSEPGRVRQVMSQLSDQGMRISMDDFGTGYSSLSYLAFLPLDVLKIDQSFVRDINNPERNSNPVVVAIISMAKSLGMEVIAEGVETEEQLAFLTRNGCNNIQGYYYSKPLPEAEITTLLKQTAA